MTNLQKQTAKIVNDNMFSWRTFDVALLDKYFEENKISDKLELSLYNYILKNMWYDTFIFTNVFDKYLEKKE